MPENPECCADRISAQITDILRAELKKPDFSPTEALVGQCLALIGFMLTAKKETPKPPAFIALRYAAERAVLEILGVEVREKH